MSVGARVLILLLAGFVVETFVTAGYWVVPMALGSGLSASGISLGYAALGALGLLGHAAVVLGIAGLLREHTTAA